MAIPARVFGALAGSDDLAGIATHAMDVTLKRAWLSIIGLLVALLVFATLGFRLLGTSRLDGSSLAAVLLSLGGHVGHDTSLAYFNSAIHAFALTIMSIGATNWLLHLKFATTRRLRVYAACLALRIFLLLVFVAAAFAATMPMLSDDQALIMR